MMLQPGLSPLSYFLSQCPFHGWERRTIVLIQKGGEEGIFGETYAYVSLEDVQRKREGENTPEWTPQGTEESPQKVLPLRTKSPSSPGFNSPPCFPSVPVVRHDLGLLFKHSEIYWDVMEEKRSGQVGRQCP